jgi:hypothetical protein
MPQNFIDCDREQPFLMPPSLRDWLPADHLAWFVIETVARLDLSVFYAAYRADGHGRATYEPSMVVSLPAELQTEAGRREWLERELAREQAAAGDGEEPPKEEVAEDPLGGFDVERIVARVQGREGWLREARRQLERERWLTAGSMPRSRSERLRLAARWLEADLAAQRRGNAAYEAFREHRRLHDPRRLGGPPKPYVPPASPQGEVNVTDPDSRRMKGNRRYIQGYNAQAVVNEQQIVIAAEITTAAGDFSHLRPMITAALSELEAAGIDHKPDVTVADAQYWNEQHMDDVTREHGIQVLIPPDCGKRKGERPGWTGGRYSFMRRVLATDLGRPKTPEVNPARLRSHQTQPQDRSLPPTRQVGSAYRVAINHDESQPHQAPPPPNSHDEVLKRPPPRPHRPTRIARHQRHRQRRPAQRPAKTFARQPPRKARLCGRSHSSPTRRTARNCIGDIPIVTIRLRVSRAALSESPKGRLTGDTARPPARQLE